MTDMKKKKQIRYVVIDLGEQMSTDNLLTENNCSFALEVHRENGDKPYSRYSVQRVIPCKFKGGKLYKS